MSPEEAIRICRHSIDGMGGEGPEYEEVAAVIESLVSRLDAITADRADALRRLVQECNRRDTAEAEVKALSSRLGPALELCREIEFFLRGHPGEASVLRAKIQAFLVETGVLIGKTERGSSRRAGRGT